MDSLRDAPALTDRARPPVAATERYGASTRAALVLFFVLLAVLSIRKVDSLDVGFHLRAGDSILEGNGWPRTDTFSFGTAGHPYVDTSWGFQVLLAAVERVGGANGLILLMAALAAGTFLLLLATARLEHAAPAAVLVLFLAGILTCELRFAVRPEWLSYFFLALVLWVLHRRAAGLVAPLWLLPLVLWLWVNCHSLFVLGFAALLCCVLGRWLESGKLDRPLLLYALASAALSLLNPYGLDAHLHSLSLLTRFRGSNEFRQVIGEFRSPLAAGSDPLQMIPLLAFRVFALLAALGTLILLQRNRWWSVFLVLALAWPALSMVRNMPILVVAAFAPAALGLGTWPPLRHPRVERVLALTAAAIALVVALRARTDAYYIDMGRRTRAGLGLNDTALPVEAVEYARRSSLEGRPLNHLNFGGYLMWATGEPVFIDGRLEVVGEDFFREANDAFVSARARADLVERYGLRWALFPTGSFPPIVESFSTDPAWRLEHVDPIATIFVLADGDPRVPAQAPAPFPLRLEDVPGLPGGPERPGRISAWLGDMAFRRTAPFREEQLATFHWTRGETELAAAHWAEAIRADRGRQASLYSKLGSALAELGRTEPAAACLRIALEEDPDDAGARQALEGLR